MTDSPEARAPSRPLRILHCAAGNLFGGLETLLGTLARHREDAPGLSQEFALGWEGRAAAELRALGAPVHLLGPLRFSRPWTVWRARRRLARLVAGRGVDVLVTHGSWPHMLAGPVASRAGRPLAHWMHDLASGAHWIERAAARTPPDMVLANSRATAATVPLMFPGTRVEVLHCPVAPVAVDRDSARAAIRAELATPAGDTVLVMAARLEVCKGHGLFLEALARLREQPSWTAWLAGGPQRSHEHVLYEGLRGRASALGLDGRVRFLGQRADVPRLLMGADVYCQPNAHAEAFGIALVEALYARLPVISTRLGGAIEVVTDDCGILVPPDDPEALAVALRALIADPSARANLGAAGPARAVTLCAPSVVLGRLEMCLNDVISARPGPRGVECHGPLAHPYR